MKPQSEFQLHFLWKYQLLKLPLMRITTGEKIIVKKIGVPNTYGGPDFMGARLETGALDWVGDVEIHINGRERYEHGHHLDKAYNKVILHVVWENPIETRRVDGSLIPVMEIGEIADHEFWKIPMLQGCTVLPCKSSWKGVRDITKISMIEKAMAERMELRVNRIFDWLEGCNGSWEELCWWWLCFNWSIPPNKELFLELAKIIPLKVLYRYRDNIIKLEALLFGVAGFLEDSDDAYSDALKREYQYLKQVHSFTERQLNKESWQFARLRPPQFPTVKLAQLAAFIQKTPHIFSLVMYGSKIGLERMICTKPNPYWERHYLLGKVAKNPSLGKVGTQAFNLFLVNAVVPFRFAYGKYKDQSQFCDSAMDLLCQMPPETNKKVKQFGSEFLKLKSAADSQGIIQLYDHYCSKHKCLNCSIGFEVLKQESVREPEPIYTKLKKVKPLNQGGYFLGT